MNFGKADRYITILKTDNSQKNFSGEVISGYSPFVSLWAKRTYAPGSEQTQADQQVGIQNCVYEVRYYPGLEQYMIVNDKIDNTLWNITSMEESGREDFIRLICFKRDNQ